MNVGFAANNETITKFKSYQVKKYDKKIINADKIFMGSDNYKKDKCYHKINIKEKFRNKYKIKSIKLKYLGNYDFKYKTYNVRNKSKFTLKTSDSIYTPKLIVKFKTKSKI